MNKLTILIYGFILLIALPYFAKAQKSDTTFKQYIKWADEAFDERKDSVLALSLYLKAIDKIPQKCVREDSTALLRASENTSILLRKKEELQQALYYSKLAYNLSKIIPDDSARYRIIPHTALIYSLMKEKGINFKLKQADNYETADVYYIITDVVDTLSDTLYVYINGGITDGLYEASKGEIGGIERAEYADHLNKLLGKAVVSKLDSQKSLLQIVPLKGNGVQRIFKGDVALMLSRIPKHSYKSVFWKFAIKQIEFQDMYKRPLLSFYQLWEDDSPEFEADVFQIMSKEVHATAEWLNSMEDKTRYMNMFTDTLPSGRFKGLSIYDAMVKTNVSDINAFLDFVLAFPGRYIGQAWIFSEIYVTWIMNKSPIGMDTFFSILLNATSSEDYKDIAEKYNEEIIENDFFISVINKAELMPVSKKEEALFILNQALKLTDYMPEKYNVGWVNFGIGHIYYNSELLDSSIIFYKKTIDIFDEIGHASGKVQSLDYLGYIYKEKQNYIESIDYFKKAKEINQNAINKRGYYLKNDFTRLASSEKGIGFAQKALGNYDEALMAFDNSIGWYDSLNTIQSKKTSLQLLSQMGEIYQKRAQFDIALNIYETQLVRYAELGDNFNTALTYDEIASIQYELGHFRTAFDIWQKSFKIKTELEKWSDAGYSMSNCGQAMWNIGNLDSALICHNTAIELRKKVNDTEGQAFSFTKAAYLYKSIGQPDMAEKYYQEALDIHLAVGDSIEIASIANYIGRFYVDLKNYTAAADFYEIARKIYETRQMKSELAEIYSNMGTLYSNLKTYSESLKYHTEALEVRRQLNERQNVMYSLIDLGFIYIFHSLKPDTALIMLNEALLIADSTGSIDYKAFCLQSIGCAYSFTGQAAKAEEFFLKSLHVYQTIADTMGQSMIICYQGDNELIRGDFAKALSHYNTSLMLARNKNFQSQMGEVYIKLTSYYYLTGEFKNAFSMIDSAYSIYYENNNMNGVAHTHISKGNTHNTIGNATEALKYYKIADSIFTSLSDPLNSALAMNNMGTIMYRQGDYDNALRLFGRGLDIIDSVGLNLSLKIYLTGNIGEVYMERGIWDEAEKYLNMSIRIAEELLDPRMVWSSSTVLGKLKSKQEKYNESNKIVSESYIAFLKSDEKMAIAECATILGYNYLKLKEYQKAQEYLNNAIQIYRTIGSRRTLWEPLYYMALLKKEENNIPEALKFLKDAVANIEDLSSDIIGDNAQKKLFAKANNKKDIYQLLITLLVESNNIKEAYVFQEKLNLYGLEEQTRGEPTRGAKDVNDNSAQLVELELKKDGIYNQLITEKSKPIHERRPEKIAELEKMMTVASEDYQVFLTELVEKEGTQQIFSNTVNPEELDQKRFDMAQDIIILQYLVTKEQIIIFMASSDTLGAKIIDISQENIEEYVNAYYKLLVDKAQLDALQLASEKLYNVLIEPVTDIIKNKNKIAVVPGGVLTKLPFQSLGKKNNNAFEYMGNRFQIFYINDMNNIVIAESLEMNNAKLLAFGNADNTLPYAEKEVNIISEMFTNPGVYLKSDAMENLAKEEMNNYQIVHFATHGILDPINFNNSYLILAPNITNNEDGMFTMNEITRLRSLRNCQLIVLSACNTAINDNKIEGFINNPAKAFLKKGAKTTIATLWSVDDAACSELMSSFYKNLFNGQNKVEALNNAQKSLILSEKFSHPYYWAAFELIGQWK